MGTASNGRRLVLLRRDCDPPSIINTGELVVASSGACIGKEGFTMLTIEGLVAVLSFGIACFGIGYAIGRKDSDRPQK